MSGFSYAQAARGQATPPSQTSVAAAPATPSSGEQAISDKDTGNSVDASQNISTTTPTLFATDSSRLFARKLSHDADASPVKDSEVPSSPAASSTLAGTATESTSIFSLDDSTARGAISDLPSHVLTPDPRSPAADDVRKGGRKGKAATKPAAEKQDEQVAQAEDADKANETVKVELVSAPLPSVNIWSQRMQEQAARTKQVPAVTTANKTTASTLTNTSGVRNKDARKQTNTPTASDVASDTTGALLSGSTKSQTRRANETTRLGAPEQPRRNVPRGARGVTDKDERTTALASNTLPLVRDAMSWPTPESAAGTDEAKASFALGDSKFDATSNKDPQDDAGSVKSRKKGWVPLPFVPSVNFQTPLPNVRNSKPKTSGRTSRDALSKPSGNSNANGINSNANTAINGAEANREKALPSSSPAKTDLEVRSTAKESSGNSLPSRPSNQNLYTNKRFSTDGSNNHSREPRKASATNLPEKPREATADQFNVRIRLTYPLCIILAICVRRVTNDSISGCKQSRFPHREQPAHQLRWHERWLERASPAADTFDASRPPPRILGKEFYDSLQFEWKGFHPSGTQGSAEPART